MMIMLNRDAAADDQMQRTKDNVLPKTLLPCFLFCRSGRSANRSVDGEITLASCYLSDKCLGAPRLE